jgi:tetratricopeptide (TPR) repeat protein
MNCDQIEREEIIEKYLTGRLDRAAQEEFEAHWFGCRECSRKLQVSRMLQEKLWEKGDKILPPTQEPVRVPSGRRAWAFSAAATVLIIAAAAVLWWQFRGPGRPQAGTKATSSSLLMLASIKPPLYVPPALRGAQDEAAERFRTGMTLYQEGRYDAAIPDLRAAVDLNPEGAGSRFFLGICLLLTGQTEAGIGELQATISLGESVYLEEAHFYLAKAHLGKGDLGRAKDEFNWVVQRSGSLKEEAARILAQLQ